MHICTASSQSHPNSSVSPGSGETTALSSHILLLSPENLSCCLKAGFLGTATPRTVSKKVPKAARTLRARLDVVARQHNAMIKAISGEVTQTESPQAHSR